MKLLASLFLLLSAMLLSAGAGSLVSATETVPGVIKLSNGDEFKGGLYFTGGKFRVYEGEESAGGRYLNVSQDEVSSIVFSIKDQSLEQPWRFKMAGSDEKEFLPGKYPLVQLRSETRLKTGKTLIGHLMATPVFIKVPGIENPMDVDLKKFVLKYQIKGDVGQEVKDLVYVTSIQITTPENGVAANGSITGSIKGKGKLEAVTAYGADRSVLIEGKIDAKNGTFKLDNLPKDVYDIAVLTDAGVYVGLSDGGTLKAGETAARPLEGTDKEAIAKTVKTFEDFYDQQEVLAVSGHRDFAKVLMDEHRLKSFYDEGSYGNNKLRRVEIWCWHMRTTEWVINQNARFTLFRFKEPKQGKEREITVVKELGGISVDPDRAKTQELNWGAGAP